MINTAFLKPINLKSLEESEAAPTWVYRNLLKPLKNLKHGLREAELSDELDILSTAAKRGLPSCTNLVEVEITTTYNDTELSSEFLDFCKIFWSKNTFGYNLTKLTITETFTYFPQVLTAIVANAHKLESLREVHLKFAETYLGFRDKAHRRLKNIIQQFIEKCKPRGTKFTFSVEAEVYHDRIRTTVPPLPYLNDIFLSIDIYDVLDHDNFTVLCEFINKQASSVTKLVIHGPSQMERTIDHFGEGSCARYVLQPGPDRFHTLRLPCLTELHINLPPFPVSHGLEPALTANTPFFSSLSDVAPALKVLCLQTRNHIDTSGFTSALVDGLPKSLESLELSCPALDATLFDSLSSKIPSLRSLTIHANIPFIGNHVSKDVVGFQQLSNKKNVG